LDRFHAWPCKLDAMAKYAPHPNLFLYHESFARTKFRIPNETFLIVQTTVPSTLATSTTSIQTYDNLSSTSAAHVPLNTRQQPVQDHRSTGPVSSQAIDCSESPVALHMQVEFSRPSMPATIAPTDLQTNAELTISNRLNLDIMFNGWETNSVKAMTLAMMTSDAQDNFLHSHDESLGMSHIDTSSDLGTSTSDYMLPQVENRITSWLQDVAEQLQTVVEYHENGSYSSPMEYWQEN